VISLGILLVGAIMLFIASRQKKTVAQAGA
jgi:hypothetical protein